MRRTTRGRRDDATAAGQVIGQDPPAGSTLKEGATFALVVAAVQQWAATADELFSVLMGEDVEARRAFIQRNAKDVRFLDI